MLNFALPQPEGLLYHPDLEHDACGVGFVADISGHRSHGILERAVESVVNLTHRGAVSADMRTGDGAGILTQLPHKLLSRDLEKSGARLPKPADLAVGMLFLPRDTAARERCQQIVEQVVAGNALRLLAWRDVPVDSAVLGAHALSTQPVIRQVLLGRADGLSDSAFERTLFLARKQIERQVTEAGIPDFYIPSFSHQTVVYKGLFVAPQLAAFYADLRDKSFAVSLAVFHQRYSTNTFPNWYLAQPFRFLGHNGEINTLQGNRNWIRAREPQLQSQVWKERVADLRPLIQPGGSDSANLDNVLETLVMSDRDVLHAMTMMAPEAWENMPNLDPAWRAFYEYHACLSEPWDGPAALAFSDGVTVGACLDRNGLRPARYKVADDGIVSMASEVGVIDMDDRRVIRKGRLGPGEMIAVDTRKGVLLTNKEIKDALAARRPYGEWVNRNLFRLAGFQPRPQDGHLLGQEPDLLRRQSAFAYTSEEMNLVLKPMFVEGKEPIGSMGDDTPLAVLSRKPRLLYDYFKQKFAQVTNPPIDPLRERIVMSLDTYMGARHSLLEESERHAKLMHLTSPFLLNSDLARLRAIPDPAFRCVTLSAVFPAADGPKGLRAGLTALCKAAGEAADTGAAILVLSDRTMDAARAPIPMALAVGAVHHHLIREGKRMHASIIAETGEAREYHHYAVLLGYGASAVNPYLALETIYDFVNKGEIENITLDQALKTYKKSVESGILKIMSKMGISAVSSYAGAQIFEAIGLSRDLVEECFTGTTSWIGGANLEDLAKDVLTRHQRAYASTNGHSLDDYGFFRFRKDGEYHANNPFVVRALHQAVTSGKFEDYKAFAQLIYGQRLDGQPTTLRDLLAFKSDRQPIPLEDVEPVEDILRRFETAAMSLGALSPEAHDALTIAMNRIGARSNTGEGGEDPTRYHMISDGDSLNCKMKQVASARFGVTTEYLVNAETLQIKMAQGSKPGEGGQLPGHKVVEHIARLRHATPGVPLISPPPHHDIYSIEDLSQLIYDLKMVNPRARVNVKLVAEAGVGTIAAGVAKAYADEILISGHDGGTGASPLSSIKNVGSPWELGLSETQQVLVMNDLRGRVTLITDGGLKTGRDVVMAACVGAEGYGFGTMAVIAAGCKMARQ